MSTTTVDGIEMFAFHRNPGAAQCDGCGKKLISNRNDLRKEFFEAGWKCEEFGIGADCWCPDCVQTRQNHE